jgi:signal transduction histidine kinase
VSRKAHLSGRQGVSLLRYWTARYLLVLLGSLFVIGVIAIYWVRSNAYAQSLELLELRAVQLADFTGQVLDGPDAVDKLRHAKEIRTNPFVIQLMDDHGNLRLLSRGKYESLAAGLPDYARSYASILQGESVKETIQADGQAWLSVGVPIQGTHPEGSGLFLFVPAEEALPRFEQLYGPIASLIGSVALAGWLVIYFLSRKLTSPLRQIAEAAQVIAEGGYNLTLPQEVKERELQQLILSFRDMAERLKLLEQMRTELLAGVSHELRTPITSIRGMIQAVLSKIVTDEEAEEFLQISLDETKRLQNMVEDLLHFSSLEAGAVPLQKKPFNLSSLVEEVIQQLSVLRPFANVHIERELPVNDVWVEGDAGMIRQILMNLLNNSCAASPPGSVIRLKLREEDEQIQLDVQDEGHGIPPEDLPFIFERFYRGKIGQKQTHGLGLGLTISRLLAQSHGGDLVLVHTSPSGTTFRLLLPIDPPDKPDKASS